MVQRTGKMLNASAHQLCSPRFEFKQTHYRGCKHRPYWFEVEAPGITLKACKGRSDPRFCTQMTMLGVNGMEFFTTQRIKSHSPRKRRESISVNRQESFYQLYILNCAVLLL